MMRDVYRYMLFCFILLWLSCNKSADLRTSLCFTTRHHDLVIPDITIYIKYNSEVFPGFDPEHNFDTSSTSNKLGQVCMHDFPLGNHWFVGFGYDSLIRQQVYGALDIEFNLRNLRVDTILFVGEE
jgi:hypothetical protein